MINRDIVYATELKERYPYIVNHQTVRKYTNLREKQDIIDRFDLVSSSEWGLVQTIEVHDDNMTISLIAGFDNSDDAVLFKLTMGI